MRTITFTFGVMFGLLIVAAPAMAQQQPPARQPIVNPTPGCTATKEQLEQVRQAGIAFTFSQGAARVALADPTYKQHNPAFVKGAREAGMNRPQMAIAWVMANPAVTAPIIGASRPEQLDETLAAAETPMAADLKKRLDDLTADYRRGDSAR